MQTQIVHKQYVSTQVSTADRLQLVVMLYDGAITFLNQAKEKMAAQDAAGKGLYLGKALDIIAELNASLNFQEGKEVAANLFHLYNFMTAHLTRANLNWDAAALDDVIKMLGQLRDAWEEVSQKSKRGEIKEVTEEQTLTPRANLGSLVV
ncbi:MAG: flagellar export chaperone FliS [Deltaproteobacteria bacterium]|nr:flagellar export chaperone FliS [Deltaproteobacteria bacterium]